MFSYLNLDNQANSWSSILASSYLFREGARNIEIACSSTQKLQQLAREQIFEPKAEVVSLTFLKRVTHFTVGLLLCIPLLNVVTYVALRSLGLASEANDKQKADDKQKVDEVDDKQKEDFSSTSTESLKKEPLKVGNLPEEVWLEIFDHLDDESLAKTKLACREWKRIANDPKIISTAQKISQENVEKLRPLLTNCVQCSEGAMGGFWVCVSVDDQGHIQALDGHDASTAWLDPTRVQDTTGLHRIEYAMHASDWDPTKSEAFFILKKEAAAVLPKEVKKVQNLMLKKLNMLAKGALAISKKEKIERNFMNQPWFAVMRQPTIYPSSQLREAL